MSTYQTTNPLARTNPLRSIPLFRPAPVRMTDLDLALWELDRAVAVLPNLKKQYVYARRVLGDANRVHRLSRRRAQAQAMRFLNMSRAKLRAGRARVAKAEAAVAALRVQPILALAA